QAVALADAAATIAVFVFSVAFDNSSFYDPYWSVAPMIIAPVLAANAAPLAATAAGGGPPLARKAAVVLLVLAGGARLPSHWPRAWQGLGQEDWRYVEKRGRGRAYWAVSFVGFHFLPTIWVCLGCLSLLPALVSGTRPLGAIDAAALAVTAGAIALETIADEQ